MSAGSVFLDSGIFIAGLDKADRNHEIAAALFADPPRDWCTSLAVVAETYGWFLHRLGEAAARVFRLTLPQLPRFELLPIGVDHHAAVVRKLDEHRGRKLTYVDASSLVFLSRRRIHEVWGFDGDLAIEGARVVPGPP